MSKMIRPIVKWTHCADHDPLGEWIPDDPEVFEVWIQVGVGPIDGPGTDDWDLKVTSLNCVANQGLRWDSSSPIVEEGWQSNTLVLSRWDYHRVLRELDAVCRNAAGWNWDAIARRLLPYGLSEYGLTLSQDPFESEAVERSDVLGFEDSLYIEDELRQMQHGHVLGAPVVNMALANLPRRDSRYLWFWGLGDPSVQAFWLSIEDDLLMRTILDNMRYEVRYILNVSKELHEQEMGRVFNGQAFQPFVNEIEARVWRSFE